VFGTTIVDADEEDEEEEEEEEEEEDDDDNADGEEVESSFCCFGWPSSANEITFLLFSTSEMTRYL
jgi:hypothetical protein